MSPRLRGPHAIGRLGVLAASAALVTSVIGLAFAFASYERHELLGAEKQRSELFARVLEDHATRSFDQVSLTLTTLGKLLERRDEAIDGRLGPLLAQAQAGVPLLHSLALVDGRGEVLASSRPGEVGLRLRPGRPGTLPGTGQEAVGAYVSGQGIEALNNPAAGTAGGPGFVPVWRRLDQRPGHELLLLALVDASALARHQQLVLADLPNRALLANAEGQVLAATDAAAVPPGRILSRLAVFEHFLPDSLHASYIGAGTRESDEIVAFRCSRTRPLVVVVETTMSQALASWHRDLRWLIGVAAGMVLVIIGVTGVLLRSMRSREAARRQRDEAQAEVALRERELSVIVKSVQELLFRTDASGRLSFVNARWQAASGCTEEAALGQPFSALVRPESTAAAAALFLRDRTDGVRSAQIGMGPEGELRQFEVAVVPLRANGGIVGFAGSAVDITEQHNADSKLRAQLAFTELLLEVMPLPLSILDRRGRYVSVNHAWEEFTGRVRTQVVGTLARDALPPAEAKLHDAHDRQLLERGGQIRYDAGMTHRDGSRRDLAITKAAVPGDDGRPAGILVAFMDVTDFRQAERATREARDAAEEASRAKTEFVANISHELRTPLQSIIGFSELGVMRSGQQLKLGSMFSDIHAAGQRMLALVNDLLDVSKIESTVGTFHLERTDVRSLVRDVIGELQPLLAARQIGVSLRLSEGPLVAKVDPTRFQQVVRNVLANAIRFSPPGENLVVDGDINAEHRIEIRITDRGPGIPPAELEKIFEAFVQSSKTKDGSGGTGLGLAICRKILQAHGGEIRASNNPDGGSTFHILVPARGFGETLPGI